MTSSTILTFSHLRWDSVFQRPQQLMSRLGRSTEVLFVEEPVRVSSGEPRFVCRSVATGITVCRPCVPFEARGFDDDSVRALRPALAELLGRSKRTCTVAWLYTPMALPLGAQVEASAVVYDCMDELSAFRFAPAELLEREAQLLARADLVFTGGPSLYRAKKDRNPAVHCFPSSVDAPHFRKAQSIAEALDQAALPRPRLGFFGVLDERLDIDLLDRVAQIAPAWQIVLVGPVVKIDAALLPRRPNIHYFGARGYDELPSYLAGWDVCLLPFALNDATRFISPTKTLEYMAAELPIVSAPIRDVAEPYGEVVYVADGAEAFVRACRRALAESEADAARRRETMRGILADKSWDATAAAMLALVERVCDGRASSSRAPNEAADGHRRRALPIREELSRE